MATTKVIPGVVDLNSATSDKGLKMPSGTENNRPTAATGQIRNNTNESSDGSASAMEYYNGTAWQKLTAQNPLSSDIITLTNSQAFDRTQTTPTNNTMYTYSFWVKWTSFGTGNNVWLCTGQYPSVARAELMWDNSNTRWFYNYDAGAGGQGSWYGPSISTPTDGVWYHYCLQKTAEQRPILFINGSSIGAWSCYKIKRRC